MESARATAATLRSYCRPTDDGTLEPWSRVVERSTREHHRRLWADAGGSPDEAELDDLVQLGLRKEALVAGRTLWLGGTEYAYSRAASQFNCAYTDLLTVYDVVDAAWLLLNGCGVGAKPRVGVLHGYVKPIHELEIVPSTRPADYKGRESNVEELAPDGTWTLRVGDSAQAWAKALGKMLVPSRRGARKLVLDFSEVRGRGGRLKGYGWICNGYEPLAKAMTAVHRILNSKAGELLDELDVGDVHNLWGEVLSSRRAAEILFIDSYNPMRDEFIACKDDYWLKGNDHRRQSNNTVLYWSKPTAAELTDILHHAHRVGDPAPMNAVAAVRRAPWFRGSNPCFSGDTKVWTIRGPVAFRDLVGQEVPVLTQTEGGYLHFATMRDIRCTQQNVSTYKVRVKSLRGSHHTRRYEYGEFVATAEHVVYTKHGAGICVADLKPGDRLTSVYRLLSYGPDNAKSYKKLRNTAGDCDWEHRIVAAWKYGSRPIRPAYDVHHIDGDRLNNDPENIEVLHESEHIRLHTKGIPQSEETIHKKSDSLRRAWAEGRHRECYRRFGRNHTVVSVEYVGEQDVYCGSVDGTHKFFVETETDGGVLVHNCGEILLGAFCNLCTVCLPKFAGRFSALLRAVHLIARANYRQTCVDLRDGILQPIWHQSNEALRLCGVSLTGVCQAPWLTDYQMRCLRYAAVHGAYSMADELGTPRPKAITCNKPDGTSSKIMDCSEGIHMPLGRYVFNWVGFASSDPLVARLGAAGYRVLPHPQDSANALVCFPVECPGAYTRVEGVEVNVESAVSQLDRYLRWNRLWSDHNSSCTVSFDETEIPAVVDWLLRNWDRGYVSCAFIQRSDPTKTAADLGHPYIPQEVVSEAKYREYCSTLRDVDYAGLTGHGDVEDGCSRGTCPAR